MRMRIQSHKRWVKETSNNIGTNQNRQSSELCMNMRPLGESHCYLGQSHCYVRCPCPVARLEPWHPRQPRPRGVSCWKAPVSSAASGSIWPRRVPCPAESAAATGECARRGIRSVGRILDLVCSRKERFTRDHDGQFCFFFAIWRYCLFFLWCLLVFFWQPLPFVAFD